MPPSGQTFMADRAASERGSMKITIGYLYDNVMSVYGDRGNLICLQNRCGWRGIDTEVRNLRVGDTIDPDDIDIFFIGGGADSQQQLIGDDLANLKGPAIREAIEQGAAALAVCAGYQQFGEYYKPIRGPELRGLGLFDAHTVHHGAELGISVNTLAEAGNIRSIGNLAVQWGDDVLLGFESHGGRTYLGSSAKPLGSVIFGQGNNSVDGTEGIVYRNAVGTYLHGPCLPKNPHLADYLIRGALSRRYGDVELSPLDDSLELQAHDQVLTHVRQIKPGKMMTTHHG